MCTNHHYLSMKMLWISLAIFIHFNAQASDEDLILKALKMETYESDTSAHAVIISDIGRSYFRFDHPLWDIELDFERTIIVKIFSSEGFDWADYEIPLYVGGRYKEEMGTLKGFSYEINDKGKLTKVKLSKDAIFREETNENWNQVKVTMPNIKEGSVYVLQYTVRSPYPFNLQSWNFQRSIPTLYSEYNTQIPEYLVYNKNIRGYHPMESHDESSRTTTLGGSNSDFRYIEYLDKWVAKDIPAFKEEPYLSNSSNYMSAITFELSLTKFPNTPHVPYTSSWEAINQKLIENESFGKALDKSAFIRKVLPEILTDGLTEEEKIATIYNHIKEKLKWNGDNRLYVSDNLKKAYETGIGNSADINLLLTAFCREAGLHAYPVALSTRSNGLLFPTFPTLTSFNYVISLVLLGDKYVLIDATEKHSQPGTLPQRCLNQKGRLIDQSISEWIPLETGPTKSKTVTDVRLEDGLLVGTKTDALYDQAAFNYRGTYTLTDHGEAYATKMEDAVSGLIINDVKVEGVAELDKPIKAVCDIELEEHVDEVGDLLYFNPMLLDQRESNPFKSESRSYPVEFANKLDEFYFFKFSIPYGYTVETLPEKLAISLPDQAANYLYDVSVAGNMLTLRSSLKINKTLFSGSEYPALRNFYDLVVKKQAEQVVLKRM